MGRGIYSVEMLDEVMIHVPNRFHHTPDNGTQLKTYELFSLRILHLIFLDCSYSQITKTLSSKTTDKAGVGEGATLEFRSFDNF